MTYSMAYLSLAKLQRAIQEHRFGLAAFLIPLSIRAVPEILVGPYPVGFDTIAFYVPNTLDWAAGKVGLLPMLGMAPLMYAISVPIHLLLKVDPVWIFKFLGPIFYGSMIWTLFRFLVLELKWSKQQALGGALFASLYFVTLRIGWDLYRNTLGLAFILLALPLLKDGKGIGKQVLLSAIILLAVASDQLTAAIGIFFVSRKALMALVTKRASEFLRLVGLTIPGLSLFFLSVLYSGAVVSGGSLIQDQPPLPSLDAIASSVGFLAYAYLPILPLAIVGFNKVQRSDLTIWAIFCIVGALLALLPFVGLNVPSYRWSLLLDIPLCVYATKGLAWLSTSFGPATGRFEALRGKILPFFSAALVASAILYVGTPAQFAPAYYTMFPALMPTSLTQNSVPLSDMQSLRNALSWAAENTGAQTALITHGAVYGWARAYLPQSMPIVNYWFSSPLVGIQDAKLDGFSSVLLVWWANGLGWYGQAEVPGIFTQVFRDGNICVYSYEL